MGMRRIPRYLWRQAQVHQVVEALSLIWLGSRSQLCTCITSSLIIHSLCATYRYLWVFALHEQLLCLAS